MGSKSVVEIHCWCFEWSTSRMFQVKVILLNGNPELLTLPPSSTVQDVRIKAQRAFGKKYLKLVTAKNRVLVNVEQTLEEAEIEDGECLTPLVLQPGSNRGSSRRCLLPCGVMEIAPSLPGVMQTMVVTMVVTSAVRDQLKGVLQIQATGRAFAAILARCCRINWSSGPPIGHPRTNWRSRRSIDHAASGKYCSKGPTCGSL